MIRRVFRDIPPGFGIMTVEVTFRPNADAEPLRYATYTVVSLEAIKEEQCRKVVAEDNGDVKASVSDVLSRAASAL